MSTTDDNDQIETETSQPPKRLLEASELAVEFDGQVILQNINISIEAGETVAVIGESGCGKTVFMKSLVGLIPPTRGTITFDGEKLTGLKPFRIAQRGIGLVPEGRRVFAPLTVEQKASSRGVQRIEGDRGAREKGAGEGERIRFVQ